MKFILITSPEGMLPNTTQMTELQKHGTVEVIKHVGKLADLTQLAQDTSDKVFGVDPDAFAWDFDAEAIKNIPNVKAVCPQSTAFDWVKPAILKEYHVPVANCPGFSADAVAEHAVGMMIDLARHLPLYIKNSWKVDWQAPKPMLLKGKKLGVIGLGRIGKRICELGQGLGMEVMYWSRTQKDARFTTGSLEQLFQQSDVIIPALAENSDTKQLLTLQLLDQLKPTALLIGINRIKTLWDEAVILEKVREHKLGGYAFEGDNAKELTTYEGNVLALPAMAWYTQESLDNLLEIWVANMLSATGTLQNRVN